ncbi:porin family protein [Natronoflexus pectinivorans]|uniref:Outer membrane protein with beta-barrel domain n=1 Tax=Natronoflexus pectinivorans TaxID=682526 RepID=A0A4R2GII3_9BACT|nr:porin family protein [Natronoflexus pectinivorans]TCO08011.1 outer membrane protein with beta-barrel domain [Natronoflexus pectinivorans]
MKRILIFLPAVFLLFTVAEAQSRFELGLKAGYNSTSFNTGKVDRLGDYTFQDAKDDFRSGFMIGAYSRIGLFGNLSLQPELYYARKSGSTEFRAGSEILNEKVTYYSWDLPILAHLRVLDLKVANVYGVVGPVASFQASERSSVSGDLASVWSGDRLNDVNWNFQAGLGAQVWKFSLDARYEWGLNDLSRSELDRKSRTLMFTLGYRLFGF